MDERLLPPELMDRIKNTKRRFFAGCDINSMNESPAAIYSGGWVPYSSYSRKHRSSSSNYDYGISGFGSDRSPLVTSHAAQDNKHWLSRHSVVKFLILNLYAMFEQILFC